MLFSRYADPISLVGGYIASGMMARGIDAFVDGYVEDQTRQVWLHKVFDKSYDEFKAGIKKEKGTKKTSLTKEQAGATISNSMKILENFAPGGGERNDIIRADG